MKKNSPFRVELEDLDISFEVSAEQSIVEAAAAAGIEIPTACENGHCGSCVMKVLEGEVEHRDRALTEDKQAQGWMCACVSRAKGDFLKLEVW